MPTMASVTYNCSCQHCSCIAPVPSAGAVCHSCSIGQHR